MKLYNKVLIAMFFICMFCSFISPIFAGNITQNFGFSAGTAANGELTSKLNNVWGLISLVVNFISVALVVFAGLRYMFASADQKADIKKQTVILLIGAVFVFAAGNIVKLIADTATKL